jgi:hypothetical protein
MIQNDCPPFSPNTAEQWLDFEGGFQGLIIAYTPKFSTHHIIGNDTDFLLKVARTEAAQADLANTARWSRFINQATDELSFKTPNVQANIVDNGLGERPTTSVAHFDWVDGYHTEESDIDSLSAPLAMVVRELSSIKVDWQGRACDWLGRNKVLKTIEFLPDEIRKNVSAAYTEEQRAKAKSGVVHGDLAPKNIMISNQDDESLWLIDAEFGTHGERPDFAIPRMHDAAYYYHLLQVQYQNPAAAETFLNELGEVFSEDKTWKEEFLLSVIERTLSMFENFIVNPKEGFEVDERRKQEESYHSLLGFASDELLGLAA